MTKKISLVLVFLFFLFAAVMPTAADQPDQKTVKKIEKLIKKGDAKANKKEFDKAFEIFNKALELSTEYAPTYFAMAKAYNMQKNFAASIENLQKAVQADPRHAPSLDLLTKTLIGIAQEKATQRKLQEAISYYEKVLEIPGIENSAKEQLTLALFQLGVNYSALNNPAKSNEYLLKLLAIPELETFDKTKYVSATYQAGANFFNLAKLKEANRYLAKLIKMQGLKDQFLRIYSMSLYLLGVTNSQLKEFQTSSEYLLKYLELTVANPSDPFAPIVNFLIGSNHFQLLEKEVAPIKNDPKEKQKASKIAVVAKKHENIQAYLAKAIQLKPELEPAYMQLGNYYYYCQDLEKAIQTYKTLIEKFAASPDITSYKKFLEGIEKQKEQLEKK